MKYLLTDNGNMRNDNNKIMVKKMFLAVLVLAIPDVFVENSSVFLFDLPYFCKLKKTKLEVETAVMSMYTPKGPTM